MKLATLGVLLIGIASLYWLWRSYRHLLTQEVQPGVAVAGYELQASMASGLMLVLICVTLLFAAVAFGLFPENQAQVITSLYALIYGVLGLWFAGLGWLGELSKFMGSRWLWLAFLTTAVSALAVSGLFNTLFA